MERRNTFSDVMDMADAAEFISIGDVLNSQLRVNQDWSLLPDIGVCSSVAPCLIVKGRQNYCAFPQWLGKNSTQRKSMRQIRELKQVMGQHAYATRRSVQAEFVPLILLKLFNLMSDNKVEMAIEFLDSLGISNEMFKEHLIDLCMNK